MIGSSNRAIGSIESGDRAIIESADRVIDRAICDPIARLPDRPIPITRFHHRSPDHPIPSPDHPITRSRDLRSIIRFPYAASAIFSQPPADSLANPQGTALAFSDNMIRLEQVRSEVLERFERVDRRFAANDQRLARIDQRTQELSDRIELLLASLREPRVETRIVTGSGDKGGPSTSDSDTAAGEMPDPPIEVRAARSRN